MRLLVACGALPAVISFTTSSQLHSSSSSPRWHRCLRQSISCGTPHSFRASSNPGTDRVLQSVLVYEGGIISSRRSRERSVRLSAKGDDGQGEGSANLDDSDDGPVEDSEIYASLRARLVELETRAELEQQQQQRNKQFESTRSRMNEQSRSREVDARPQRSPEERTRDIALLTIQSVGVISVALVFGTVVLYWLAGDYFVHFGPRNFPGASPRSVTGQPSIGRTFDGERRGEEDEAEVAPRRGMGGSATKDPFHFEGFPVTTSSRTPTVVKPDL